MKLNPNQNPQISRNHSFKPLSRRDFIKKIRDWSQWSALASISPWISSCSSVEKVLDRWFLGDERDLTQDVVILGGGAAGLMAAYTLKLNKIPYQIFESSGRVGGRVLTISGLTSSENQPIDMGAELFSSSDSVLMNLAKDLRVEMIEEKNLFQNSKYYFDEKPIEVKKWEQGFRKFNSLLKSLYPKTKDDILNIDQKKIEDVVLITHNEIAPWLSSLLRTYSQQTWGADPDQVSLFMLMQKFKMYPSFDKALFDRRWRVKWGTSILIQSLFERATGVLLQNSFHSQHELIRVVEDRGIFKLYFQTPLGEKMIRTQQVICTIPYSSLRRVVGINEMNWNSEAKIQSIYELGYGIQTKMAVDVSSEFFPESVSGGLIWGNFASQSFWQRTVPLRWPKKWNRGVLMAQRGGLGALALGDSSIEELYKNAQIINSRIKERSPYFHIHPWGDSIYALGSHSFFKQGQITKWQSQFKSPEYEGRWLFAGEHISDFSRGSLNGALETGQSAALSMVQLRKENPI